MDDWEKLNETSLPEKEDDFYTHLNMEDITDAGCAHAKRVYKEVEIKNLEEILLIYPIYQDGNFFQFYLKE